ncbi:hypothetical protein DK28_0206135 [Peptococcaceae bacterium SCADC1_2_3]|jgi:hypothetical protein|nr:hypothetical protein DK28_0206000 [Peptococcaceae bacterium SCADC1_2_3]KFD41729.1 hypothetical protein DK28_0206135 [Peptococcaceae bacterium SCADC1_2_3]KFI34601.1 hypothetical protein HY00_11095 [Peptococcaceae bacterium SCADC1_2_3]
MKKFAYYFLTAILSVTLFANIVYAAYQYYSATLPPFKGDTTLISGTKTTGYDNIFHRNISIGGNYDAVDVWIDRKNADNSWTRVSDNVTHYEGGGPYTTPVANVDLLSGQFIRARGQNHDSTWVNVAIQGEIDLR